MILIPTKFINSVRSRHYDHTPRAQNPSYTIADIHYDDMFRRGKRAVFGSSMCGIDFKMAV